MAKKKVAASGSARKTAKSAPKKAAPKKSSKKAVKKKVASSAGAGNAKPISTEEIGNTAGEIWNLLEGNPSSTLAVIKKSIKAPEPIIMAAIGWLAREDKLQFEVNGRATRISLR